MMFVTVYLFFSSNYYDLILIFCFQFLFSSPQTKISPFSSTELSDNQSINNKSEIKISKDAQTVFENYSDNAVTLKIEVPEVAQKEVQKEVVKKVARRNSFIPRTSPTPKKNIPETVSTPLKKDVEVKVETPVKVEVAVEVEVEAPVKVQVEVEKPVEKR